MVAEYRRKSRYLVDGANAIDGIQIVEPGGTYYA
jgi:aspartate/methionine/tyrosine aminotransferase